MEFDVGFGIVVWIFFDEDESFYIKEECLKRLDEFLVVYFLYVEDV